MFAVCLIFSLLYSYAIAASNMSSFIKNPGSIEELRQNVQFQMENVEGWLSVNDYQSALIKAKCLLDALQAIVAAEESEQDDLQSHNE